jgi:ABC-type lipoprotein release transport system permease subunit
VNPRVVYANNCVLYVNGQSQRLRRVTGLDWNREASRFSRLDFSSGGVRGLAGTHGALISDYLARKFQLRVGDSLTLNALLPSGEENTASLIVRGVYNDASIFGYYNCYVDIDLLRNVIGMDGDQCTQVGVDFGAGGFSEKQYGRLYAAIAAHRLVYPLGSQRAELAALSSHLGPGERRFGVIPVENYADKTVMDLIGAIEAITNALILFLALIVLAGIRNVTKMTVLRRVKEFGSLRAMGMRKTDVVALVLAESAAVATAAFCLSLLTRGLCLLIISRIKLPWLPGFDIFLKGGYLSWGMPLPFLAGEWAALIAVCALGALGPARFAAKVHPAVAMSSD